jgi:hypothetical protein
MKKLPTTFAMILLAPYLLFGCSTNGGSIPGYDASVSDTLKADATQNDGVSPDTGSTPGAEVWLDVKTGLTWQQAPSQELGQESAIAYCDALMLKGKGDWRLPTVSELRAILRGCAGAESSGACGVTIDCLELTCTNTDCDGCDEASGPANDCYWAAGLAGECSSYWSSSVSDDATYGWYVHFAFGGVGYLNKGDINRVRCVR